MSRAAKARFSNYMAKRCAILEQVCDQPADNSLIFVPTGSAMDSSKMRDEIVKW